jgi:hypothetical protein
MKKKKTMMMMMNHQAAPPLATTAPVAAMMIPLHHHHRQKLGAVERLGKTSGPAPQVALTTNHLNVAMAPTRRGHYYEKAASRQSRHKRALELHGEVSRDDAVPLGKNRIKRDKTKRRKVMEVTMDITEDDLKRRAMQREIQIRHAQKVLMTAQETRTHQRPTPALTIRHSNKPAGKKKSTNRCRDKSIPREQREKIVDTTKPPYQQAASKDKKKKKNQGKSVEDAIEIE